jgi:hypothetical protein
MTTRIKGYKIQDADRDTEGHRSYSVMFRVVSDDTLDGPAIAMTTPGLPLPGSTWFFGNDIDDWAWCRWDSKIKPVTPDEPCTQWDVTLTFSTKPPDTRPNSRQSSNCRDTQVEDPLLEPQKVSGSWQHYTQEAATDRFGRPTHNSAFEPIHGPQMEFDQNRDQVVIEQNVASLDLPIVNALKDHVNAYVLWGCPPRTIKLSGFTWEKKYHGDCFYYYSRRFTFDIDTDNTWDRDIGDEGTKALNGHLDANRTWVLENIGGQPPDPNNPLHFNLYKDSKGENARCILDGHGQPAIDSAFYVALNANLSATPPSAHAGIWQKVVGQTTGTLYSSAIQYKAGNIVSTSVPMTTISLWVALVDPPVGDAPPSANWQELPIALSDRKVWSAEQSYQTGDVVTDPTVSHGPGKIHVEKYDGGDFLTYLGIPVTL